MKKIKLRRPKEKVTLTEIKEFEYIHGFRFPEDYIEFLTLNNGGSPVENTFWDGEIESDVAFFYPMKYGNHTLEKVIKNIHREDALPKEYFPFASTGGGSMYTFSMKDDDFGSIYLFHFDGSEPFKYTDSFEDFINHLIED